MEKNKLVMNKRLATINAINHECEEDPTPAIYFVNPFSDKVGPT